MLGQSLLVYYCIRSFMLLTILKLLFTEGTYSVLQVVIALQRHTGYFLIQIYLPCTLLVVLSWVGFWLNREATSDRVGLGRYLANDLSMVCGNPRAL